MGKFRIKLFFKLSLIVATGLTLGYFLIPKILVYPEFSNSVVFQKSVEKYSQIEQYLLLGFLSIIFIYTFLLVYFRKYTKYYNGKEPVLDMALIQEKSLISNIQILGFFLLAYLLDMVLFALMIPGEFPVINVIFVFIATGSWVGVVAIVFGFILKKDLFKFLTNASQQTNDYEFYVRKKNLIFHMVVSLFTITVILFTFMFIYGYSTASNQLAKQKYLYYSKLNVKDADSIEDLKSQLHSFKNLADVDYYYIIEENKKPIVEKGQPELTNFMIQYIKQFSFKTSVAYDTYVFTKQANIQTIKINGKDVKYGFIYQVKTSKLLFTLSITLLVAIAIYILILWYWSRNMMLSLLKVETSLEKYASNDDVDLNAKIVIGSADEVGSIANAYNKIQDLTKEHIDSINEKQDILIKQEQLVTLGELAGGMAHDINTPIAAINYGIDVLSKQVTDEKQMEIIRTMKDCSLKIITIVNDLRNQIRNLGTNDLTWFKFTEIVKESQVLTHNKLVKGGCTLNIDVDPNLELYGERNKLGQVITNMVVNAIQAYDKMPITEKLITIQAYQDGDNAIIKVTDRAGGIPDQMRESMFKAIMTTKGSEGTGIGMYLAYSVIRSVFKGQLTFETATGAGTTFIMVIPNNKEKINAEIKATPVTQTVLPTHVEPVAETPIVNQETSS